MENIKKQIKQSSSDFFKKIIEGEPQVRELEVWEEKPEASYFRLKEYYKSKKAEDIIPKEEKE